MAALEWIRFLVGAFLLLCGLGMFAIEMIGVFRFKYVMNRMHAAAMGDTLGIGFSMLGLIVMSGVNFTSLKLLFVIIFLWFSSPASSHLIARLEVMTDGEKEKHYRVVDLKTLQAELAAGEAAEAEAAPREGAPCDGANDADMIAAAVSDRVGEKSAAVSVDADARAEEIPRKTEGKDSAAAAASGHSAAGKEA